MARVLITGASSGFGEALAIEFENSGHNVIACGRNQEKLNELASQYAMDIRIFDQNNGKETELALRDASADIYILNAGTCEYVDAQNIESELFERVFTTNVFGNVKVLRAILPQCKPGVQIIFVDSLARLLPFTRSQAYGASKAALHYLAKSFAVDLAKKNIRVKTLSPGFIKTPLTDKNDFDMPMCISASEAAKYAYKGIFSGKSSIYFPFRFSLFLRVLGLLPEYFQHKICLNMLGNNTGSKK
ncbi:SDR family NAD(P)-dependent oxidoreductase [Agaribacter flavus]|uniref:SDR family NAD(P)-dependent oxidoreductase n=1 Tax=Agaribacter flavus TaxID=1902781 RepID=A0ABV7FRT8_9ALTE